MYFPPYVFEIPQLEMKYKYIIKILRNRLHVSQEYFKTKLESVINRFEFLHVLLLDLVPIPPS